MLPTCRSPPPSYHALHIHTMCTSWPSPNAKSWDITHGTKWHSTDFETCTNLKCSRCVDFPPPPTMPFASTRRVHLGGHLIPRVGTSCMEPNGILRVLKHAWNQMAFYGFRNMHESKMIPTCRFSPVLPCPSHPHCVYISAVA